MAQRTDEVNASDAGPAADNRPDDADAEAIRDDIERTRAEMSGTIDAIQERLNPTNIKEQVMDQVREQFTEAKETVREATIGKVEHMVQAAGDTVYEARRTVVDTIRDNPVPAALAGLGLGWLIISGMNAPSRSRSRSIRSAGYRRGRYGDGSLRSYGSNAIPYSNQRTSPGVIAQGQRAVGDTVDKAKDMASDLAENVQETAGEWMDTAQEQAQWVGDRFQDTVRESPLTIAAAALAAGAVVGFVIPQTRKENELMGEARDNFVEGAQDIAREAMQKVERVADRVADRAESSQPSAPARPPAPR